MSSIAIPIILNIIGFAAIILAFIKGVDQNDFFSFLVIGPFMVAMTFFPFGYRSTEGNLMYFFLIIGWLFKKLYSKKPIQPKMYFFSQTIYEKVPAHFLLFIIAAGANFYYADKWLRENPLLRFKWIY